MASPLRPSPEALAFLADPANRDTRVWDASAIGAWRQEKREEAEAHAETRASRHEVALEWVEVAGVRSLQITPNERRNDARLLYLFGGAFIMGGPLEDLMISAALATGTGLQVISPAYALAPEHPFPAGLNDALVVARAMLAEGPLAIAGESAAGGLALSATQLLQQEGLSPFALALLSPAGDMSDAFDPDLAPDDPTLTSTMIRSMPHIYTESADKRDPLISPLYGNFSPDWPPTMITTGTNDKFLPVCQSLAKAIGAPAHLRVWPELWHVFEYYEGIPEAEDSLKEISTFLNNATGGLT